MAKRGWVRFKVPISTDPGQIQAAVDSGRSRSAMPTHRRLQKEWDALHQLR